MKEKEKLQPVQFLMSNVSKQQKTEKANMDHIARPSLSLTPPTPGKVSSPASERLALIEQGTSTLVYHSFISNADHGLYLPWSNVSAPPPPSPISQTT